MSDIKFQGYTAIGNINYLSIYNSEISLFITIRYLNHVINFYSPGSHHITTEIKLGRLQRKIYLKIQSG